MNHVRVIVAVEREFGLRLKDLEVLRLRNVGELDALVAKKAGGK